MWNQLTITWCSNITRSIEDEGGKTIIYQSPRPTHFKSRFTLSYKQDA